MLFMLGEMSIREGPFLLLQSADNLSGDQGMEVMRDLRRQENLHRRRMEAHRLVEAADRQREVEGQRMAANDR